MTTLRPKDGPRACAQGFLLHRRLRTGFPAPSDVASAGISAAISACRQPGGKYVPSGIHIPVVPNAAPWTRPMPCGEGKLSEQAPTRGARLGARVPAVHDGQGAAMANSLIFEHGPELRPACARDSASQTVVTDHTRHVQVLNRDHVVTAYEVSADLVQEVPPRIGDPGVRSSYFDRGLPPIRGAFLASSQPALVALEPTLVAFPVTRVCDLLARREGSEVDKPEVNADVDTCSGERCKIRHLDVEGHVPASGRIASHSHGGRIESGCIDIRPGPHEWQWRTHLRQPQLTLPHPERRAGVGGRLSASSRLEPRVASALIEKRLKRGVLMPQRLLQRDRRHLSKEHQPRLALHHRQRGVSLRVGHGLALSSVFCTPTREDSVPHHTHAPERAVQHCPLLRSRVRPAPVCRPHASNLGITNEKLRAARRPSSVPGLKPGPSRRGFW